MAKLICELEGVHGRSLKLYDTKCVINTRVMVGGLMSDNDTDGKKTIYLCDVVGVQFKKSGTLRGYLQFETSGDAFAENTFTYENGKNGITNELMNAVYQYVTDRIEELKYHVTIIDQVPDFEAMKVYKQKQCEWPEEEHEYAADIFDEEDYIDTVCPNCGQMLSFLPGEENVECPWCNTAIHLQSKKTAE